MAQLIVRNLEDDVRDKLRDRAQTHGHSMEEEVRDILRAAVLEARATPIRLGTWCREQFTAEAGEAVEPVEFEEHRGGDAQPMGFD